MVSVFRPLCGLLPNTLTIDDMAAASCPGQLIISLVMFSKHVSGRLRPLYCIVQSKNARYNC